MNVSYCFFHLFHNYLQYPIHMIAFFRTGFEQIRNMLINTVKRIYAVFRRKRQLRLAHSRGNHVHPYANAGDIHLPITLAKSL